MGLEVKESIDWSVGDNEQESNREHLVNLNIRSAAELFFSTTVRHFVPWMNDFVSSRSWKEWFFEAWRHVWRMCDAINWMTPNVIRFICSLYSWISLNNHLGTIFCNEEILPKKFGLVEWIVPGFGDESSKTASGGRFGDSDQTELLADTSIDWGSRSCSTEMLLKL